MNKKITIIEIAEMAGVSTATVSRIINGTGKVDLEKKKRDLELIEKYEGKRASVQSFYDKNIAFEKYIELYEDIW